MPSLKDLSKKIRDYFNPEANQGDNFWGNDNPFIRGLVKTQQLPASMREGVRTILNKPIQQVKTAVNPYRGNSLANKVVTSKPFQAIGTVQNNIQDFWNNKRDLSSEVDFLSDTLSRSKAPKTLKAIGNLGLGELRTGAIALSGGRDTAKGSFKLGQNAMLKKYTTTPQQKEYLNQQMFKGGLEMGGGLLQGAYAQFRQGLGKKSGVVVPRMFNRVTTLAENSAFETLKNIKEGKPIPNLDFRGYAKDLFISDALGIRESHPLLGLALDLVTNVALSRGEERVYKALSNPRHRQAIVKAIQSGDKEALAKAIKNLEVYVKDFGKYAESAAKDQRGFANLNADINIKPDVNQTPRVTSKGQTPALEQKPLKVANQNLPTQPQGELPKQVLEAPTSQKSSVPDLPYGDSIAQEGLKGTKTLFGNEPIKTDAVSSELDSVGKAKLAQRAKLDAERAAKDDYNRWYKSQRESGQIKTTGEQLDIIGKGIEGNTKGVGAKNIEELKDIGNIAKGFDTVKRNFKAVFDKRYGEVEKEVIEPFYRGKDLMTRELESWSKSLKSLGIQKGSKISAMVQLFGEKKVSYEGLINKFGKGTADKIVDADKFFRSAYNTLIDDVNKSRAKIYPNNPEKIIPKRADYYRHFKEMQEGVAGLKNIFESPSGVQSTLAGISADTKPKSKWLSFAQRRGGDKTTYDAVGGFIDYVQKAMYAKHIDPNIENFRNLSSELEQATLDGVNKGKLNNFIEYLNDFANDLSGKTGPIDRAFQKYIPGGRKAMRALNWLNNRIKANVILMNASSSVAQLFNIPQGIANAGPKNAIKGLGGTLADIFSNKTPINKSRFVRERYSDPFSGFNTGLIDNARDMAKWLVTIGDEIGTKFIWNSHYAKALAENAPNAIKYADDATESMVAGRGIGEVPILQKDRVFQLVAPFQLEVGNLWYVMKGWVDEKQFQKLATFAVASYFMNRAAKEIRGSDVSFDPINALVEGLQAYGAEEDKKIGALKLAGRQAGEVLSNVPGGQSVAALYPEYGATVGDTKLPTRKDLFGEGDPTRYGSGLLVAKGLQDPLAKIVPPFGGQQIKRTIEGLTAVHEGESKTKGGDTQYLIDKSLKNYAQAGVFGKYSVPEAQEYFKGNKRPLSEKQSEVVRGSSDKESTYNEIMETRVKNAEETKVREAVREGGQAQNTGEKYIYYDNSSGEVKSINLNPDLTPPKLTGITELDRKAKSQYNGKITKRANDVYKLYELGQVTEEQAGKELAKLAKMKLVSGKKSVKISMGKVKRRISNIKINKARKIRSIKFRKPKSAVIKTRGVKKSLGFKVKKYAQPKPVKFINTLAGGLTKLV